MKKHIPNVLTSLNLLTGSMGIVYVFNGEAERAIVFVLVAGLFDFFDGFAARLLGVQSDIGKQLDSLADLISFGALPAFFMLQWGQSYTVYSWIALGIIVFSALRLAMFNLDDSQSDSFKGLPTPANAIMLTSLALVPFQLTEVMVLAISLASMFLLVSPIRLLALKFSSYRWAGNEARYLLIAGVILFIALGGLEALAFIIPFYIILSILSLVVKPKAP